MSINNNTKDFFGDDFEIIYEGDLPDIPPVDADDDYEDVLSTLSDIDEEDEKERRRRRNTPKNRKPENRKPENRKPENRKPENRKYENRRPEPAADSRQKKTKQKKKHKIPNLLSPAAKTAKAGGRAVSKVGNLLLRCATLLLTAAIIYILGTNFWKNINAFGNPLNAVSEKNYTMAAYAGVALFFLLFECIVFLFILSGGKKSGRDGRSVDTGRGLFSFVFIYACSYLAYLFNGLIPKSPAPLQGVQGALFIYGSLHAALLIICGAGVASCLVRKFILR